MCSHRARMHVRLPRATTERTAPRKSVGQSAAKAHGELAGVPPHAHVSGCRLMGNFRLTRPRRARHGHADAGLAHRGGAVEVLTYTTAVPCLGITSNCPRAVCQWEKGQPPARLAAHWAGLGGAWPKSVSLFSFSSPMLPRCPHHHPSSSSSPLPSHPLGACPMSKPTRTTVQPSGKFRYVPAWLPEAGLGWLSWAGREVVTGGVGCGGPA